MSSGGSWISKLFFVLLAIQLLPGALKVMKHYYQNVTVPKTKVGLVTISGQISEGGRTISDMKTFLEASDIKALVLKIDSPGGAPGASQSIYDAIKKLSKKHGKPIVSWIENVGASGAYYVAAAADHIVCTPSALVGSIGVYVSWPAAKDFIEQYKLHVPIIKSGKYKAATHPFAQMTPDQQHAFEVMVKEVHERFIADVLESRPQLGTQDRSVWAEGQPINGEKALVLGLVDELGSQLTVEERVKKLADITTELEWVRPSKRSPLAKLLGGDDAEDDHPYISALVQRISTCMGWSRDSYTVWM